MSVREKDFIPNNIYFITFTILDWKSVFTNDKYCNLIYKWFDYIKENYGNKIHGYIIMPNHIHCLIYITDKSPKLSTLIQNAKRFLAYQIVALLKEDIVSSESYTERPQRSGELLNFFQSRAEVRKGAKHKVFKEKFDAKIVVSPDFFLEKLNYIHNNPITDKWRLVEKPEDYKYSSASNYLFNKGSYKVDIVYPY